MITTQKHWWTTADALTAGTRLGDFVDGVFQPATVVLHATVVPNTTMCRIVTTAGTFTVQRDATFYAFAPVIKPLILTRNITAADLAMDTPDEDGYAADDVIGTAGSVVHTTGNADNDLVEVTGFINDPLAVGFIPADAAVDLPNIPKVPTDIVKTIVTITALHRADNVLGDHIEDVIYEMREGEAVGLETNRVTVPVPADKVEDELVAVGNDGTFFDDPFADDEAQD